MKGLETDATLCEGKQCVQEGSRRQLYVKGPRGVPVNQKVHKETEIVFTNAQFSLYSREGTVSPRTMLGAAVWEKLLETGEDLTPYGRKGIPRSGLRHWT